MGDGMGNIENISIVKCKTVYHLDAMHLAVRRVFGGMSS